MRPRRLVSARRALLGAAALLALYFILLQAQGPSNNASSASASPPVLLHPPKLRSDASVATTHSNPPTQQLLARRQRDKSTPSPVYNWTLAPTPPTPPTEQEPPCESSRRFERPGRKDGPLINVVHVPKASGTSLRKMLSKFAIEAGIQLEEANAQNQCARGHRPAINRGVFIGHCGFGLGSDAPANIVQFVVVREPISRFLSWLNYLVEMNRAPLEWRNKSLDAILQEFELHDSGSSSASRRLIQHALNEQLSHLAGYQCVEPTPDYNPHNCSLVDYYSSTSPCSPATMSRLAIANLYRAAGIGLANQMARGEVFVIMRHHLDWIPREHGRPLRDNMARKRAYSQLSEASRSWLMQALGEEIKVYALAKHLSAQHLQRALACERERNTVSQ